MEYYDPTIESSYRRQAVIDEKACILEILDTAGQDEYTALRSQWIRSGEGYLIAYDITSRSSFEKTEVFRNLILREKDVEWVPIVLIGNKCDLEENREVTTIEGIELAKNWNAKFFECSAKKRKNIDESFFEIVRIIRKTNEQDNKKHKLKKNHFKKLKDKGCIIL